MEAARPAGDLYECVLLFRRRRQPPAKRAESTGICVPRHPRALPSWQRRVYAARGQGYRRNRTSADKDPVRNAVRCLLASAGRWRSERVFWALYLIPPSGPDRLATAQDATSFPKASMTATLAGVRHRRSWQSAADELLLAVRSHRNDIDGYIARGFLTCPTMLLLATVIRRQRFRVRALGQVKIQELRLCRSPPRGD